MGGHVPRYFTAGQMITHHLLSCRATGLVLSKVRTPHLCANRTCAQRARVRHSQLWYPFVCAGVSLLQPAGRLPLRPDRARVGQNPTMTRLAFSYLLYSYPTWITEITDTVSPRRSAVGLSLVLQTSVERVRSIAESIPIHEFPTRAIPNVIVRSGPPRGLAGELEMTVFAGSVDFGGLIQFPDWTARVFVYAGLCLLLLGLMAWLGSHRLQRRAWGRRLTLSGGGLFVVGSAWNTFLDLLRYVLG